MPLTLLRIISTLIACALVALIPTTAKAQTHAPTPIIVTAPTTAELLPLFYAIQTGMFEKAGLAVTVVPTTSGSAATTAIAGGAAQIGSSNILSVIVAHAKGVPLTIVEAAGQYDNNAPNNEIMVLKDSPIKSAKDLEGKTMAVTGLHDLLSLSTRSWLAQQGADQTKIHFVELPQGSMLPALQSGRVDSIHVYEPFRGQAERSATTRTLAAPYSAIGRDFVFSCWFANSAWITEHRDAALKFAQVLHDAAAYTNPHYTELIPLISSFSKMSIETIKSTRIVRVAPSMQAAQFQPVIDAAAKFGEIDKAFPAQDILLPGAP
jgi:NitT/TauT family transport system substrate-binding protein